MVEAAYVNAKEARPHPPAKETDFSRLDETGSKAACLKELLNSHCQIHGFLQGEWRQWGDIQYQEFLAAIDKLRNMLRSA